MLNDGATAGHERQRRWHQELALTFGFLRMSKAELMTVADDPDMIDAFKARCEAVRETSESLKAAVHFMESAETRNLPFSFEASASLPIARS
jgi:hypothetical protein